MLAFLSERFGWSPVTEVLEGRENIIALTRDKQSITLEPGGQVEMSGAPARTLREVKDELTRHTNELEYLMDRFGVRFEWRGLNPRQTPETAHWMPKGRYRFMRRYMPTVGDRGLWMMSLTCTVQVNLDFQDEAHFSRGLKTGTGLSALITALFANSPLTLGEPNGYQSYRSHIWTRTDPARSHLHRFVFDTDAGFEDYIEWLLDTPMYFIYRKGYREVPKGLTFRQFMRGGLPGEGPDLDDWKLHVSTVFPDVRARPHLEFRSADVVPPWMIPALPALCVGVFYDAGALEAAWDLVKGWTFDERVMFAADVAKDALRARRPRGKGTAQDLCRDLLQIAQEGLERETRAGRGAAEDVTYLKPLWDIVDSGRTLADRVLAGERVQDVTA